MTLLSYISLALGALFWLAVMVGALTGKVTTNNRPASFSAHVLTFLIGLSMLAGAMNAILTLNAG